VIALGTELLAGFFSEREDAHAFVRHLDPPIRIFDGEKELVAGDHREAHRSIEKLLGIPEKPQDAA
jgi:hypothetical protein